jgi:selenide,water dikinase
LSSPNPRIFLGIQDFDDAGAYELANGSLLVQSVDVIASLPVRPYDFGAICAAHCLSDLYAKGVVPQTALSVLFYSFTPYCPDQLDAIFSGLLDKLNEADVALIGGHTIDEESLFCGLAVSGVASRDGIIRKTGAQPGDLLLLTKPIGTGIVSLATRHGMLGEFPPSIIKRMTTLSSSILKLVGKNCVHASTDVTGAGLAGSLFELAIQNSVEIAVNAEDVPCYEQALTYAATMEEDGALLNRSYVEGRVRFVTNASKSFENLFYDPQTSGGLLLAVAPTALGQVIDSLNAEGTTKEKLIIGEVIRTGEPKISVT